MFDLHTAVQTALSPAVAFSVIAALVIVIVAQAYFDAWRMRNRLHAQARRFGKITGMTLAAVVANLKSESEREVGRAIEFTYSTLKDIGFDKLARGDVTFEGVMFGGPLPGRPFRGLDPLAPFSLDDLKEALRPKAEAEAAHPKDTLFVDSHGGVHDFEEPRKNTGDDDEGAGPGGKGQRPYHKATDFDLSAAEARRPRAD